MEHKLKAMGIRPQLFAPVHSSSPLLLAPHPLRLSNLELDNPSQCIQRGLGSNLGVTTHEQFGLRHCRHTLRDAGTIHCSVFISVKMW